MYCTIVSFPLQCEKLELSSLRSQLIGMMECWNIGMLGLKDWEHGRMVAWGVGVMWCWVDGEDKDEL